MAAAGLGRSGAWGEPITCTCLACVALTPWLFCGTAAENAKTKLCTRWGVHGLDHATAPCARSTQPPCCCCSWVHAALPRACRGCRHDGQAPWTGLHAMLLHAAGASSPLLAALHTRRWMAGECRFGDRCNFAHGEEELRAMPPREGGGSGGGVGGGGGGGMYRGGYGGGRGYGGGGGYGGRGRVSKRFPAPAALIQRQRPKREGRLVAAVLLPCPPCCSSLSLPPLRRLSAPASNLGVPGLRPRGACRADTTTMAAAAMAVAATVRCAAAMPPHPRARHVPLA